MPALRTMLTFSVFFLSLAVAYGDEPQNHPYQFDKSTEFGTRLAAYLEKEKHPPGIIAASELMIGTEVDLGVMGDLLGYIDSVMESDKRTQEIREIRLKSRLALEPLRYVAQVSLADHVAGTKNDTTDTVAIDGYRAKYVRDGLRNRSNSDRSLMGHGFDGEFEYRYQATLKEAVGYVGHPPTSRTIFFPRSHLLQMLHLIDVKQDLLGSEEAVALSLDNLTATVWNYDGPAINGAENLIAYGDLQDYIILDPHRSYSLVGGFSGRLKGVQTGEKAVYEWSDSYSELKTSGKIPVNPELDVPETISLIVKQNGKEVIVDTVHVTELVAGQPTPKESFDVIPNGVVVMNEVSNLGYTKGSTKSVPLALKQSLDLKQLSQSNLLVRILFVGLNAIALVGLAAWWFKKRRNV